RRDTTSMWPGQPREQRSRQAATGAATRREHVMKILDRCGALTGVAFVVLANVGNAMSTDASPRPNPDHSLGQQDHRLSALAQRQRHRPTRSDTRTACFRCPDAVHRLSARPGPDRRLACGRWTWAILWLRRRGSAVTAAR